MEIGTHNSMTYLPLKNWWIYPFNWLAKCQSKSVKEQFEDYGIRLFDIRINYDKNKELEFRHGMARYKGDVYNVLEYLNSQNVPIKIRILLEESKEDLEVEKRFGLDIVLMQEHFPNLTFYEGRRKFDWKQILDLPTLEVEQYVSSMQGSNLEILCPKYFAKKYNAKNKQKDFIIGLFDFIEIG